MGGVTKLGQRGRIPSLALLATLLGMQPRVRLAFWAASAHCLSVHVQLFIHQLPQVLLLRAARIPFLPSLYLCLQLTQPMGRSVHLALLNFMRFAWAHLSSLSRSLWMASCSLGVLIAPLSLVSSANLLRVHSIPLSISPTKMLNSAGPNTNP